MNDDDILRRALHRPTEAISSYRVLQDLRPAMRRARRRRRVTVGATAALLLLGGGAGVLALTSGSTSPTVRTSDDSGAAASTLPPVNEPLEDRQVSDEPSPTAAAVPVTIVAPAVVTAADEPESPEAPETPESAPEPGTDAVTPPPVKPEMPTTTPAPAAVPPPPAPVAPTTEVLNSACGDVVVEIDGPTVRIASITPLAGYTPQVATDGPESVEMKFVGTGDSCEVHAELRSSGLDVEIQSSDHDD